MKSSNLNTPIKALIFDVFGTLVDWRTSVASHAKTLLSAQHSIDWLAFADAWRDQYQPSMQKVRSGEIPFCSLDTLHLINLNRVIQDFSLKGIDENTKQELNLAWHRLNAWSDTLEGLTRLRERFVIAPCSNGNISLMIDLARHNRFHWDAILGSEIAGNYKPNPIVYRASVKALGLGPNEVMMVAAHTSDLKAAAEQGLKTAFIARPLEHGPKGSKNHPQAETQALTSVDYSATDLLDLAKQLNC
jgi:2-haloacid dehalogenase